MSRTFIDDIEDSLKEISPYPWSSIVVDPKTNKAVITKADCGQNITYCTIHADVNGAYNILRKRKPSFGWSRGFVVKPTNLAFSY